MKKKKDIVTQNLARLKHILSLYNLTEDKLMKRINETLKRPLEKKDIFSEKIEVIHLKKVDKIFKQGLYFYLDPEPLLKSDEASVFFRKTKFGNPLNFETRKIINDFENFKISLSAIAKMSDIKTSRHLSNYTIKDNPQKIAATIRKELYPKFQTKPKDFLKALIKQFSEKNILVFEFIETWNQKEKANIEGAFLTPNVIILKRQQKSLRREIFTLIHELAHYLLDIEEIEQVPEEISNNIIERWCNDFAYYFLVGSFDKNINAMPEANEGNDYHHKEIKNISSQTHLSEQALFTRLLSIKKLSKENYKNIIDTMKAQFKKQEEEKKLLQKKEKKGGSSPKPILSPLLINTLKIALYDGIINEFEFCSKLKIKNNQLDKYLT